MSKRIDVDFKVHCTWPADSVTIEFNNGPILLFEHPFNYPPPKGQAVHGYINKAALGLSIKEARTLATQLIHQANEVEKLDIGYSEHLAEAYSTCQD